VVAPQLAPDFALRHNRTPAGAAHLRVEVPRLPRIEPLAFER
jgi:hypothetical protein